MRDSRRAVLGRQRGHDRCWALGQAESDQVDARVEAQGYAEVAAEAFSGDFAGGVCAGVVALWDELRVLALVGEGSVQGALAEAWAGTSHRAQVGAELGEYAPGRAWRGSRLGCGCRWGRLWCGGMCRCVFSLQLQGDSGCYHDAAGVWRGYRESDVC